MDIKYLKKQFDELAIMTVFVKVMAFNTHFSHDEEMVMNALRRSTNSLNNASPEELGEYLNEMGENQIVGVINNTKGILHEMEFIEIENEDGDATVASIFPETNHLGTDILMSNKETGEVWEVQLKATDSENYVNEWIEKHPDGEILVTEELAEKMNLESTGMTNEEITVRTEDVVDKLIDLEDSNSVWDYFPELTALSIGFVVWGLWKRYQKGEISLSQFKLTCAKVSGLKLAKVGMLTVALSIPVVNVFVGVALTMKLILSAQNMSLGLSLNKQN